MLGTEAFSLAEQMAIYQCYLQCKGNAEKATKRYLSCYPHLGRRIPDESVFALLEHNWTMYGEFNKPRAKIEEDRNTLREFEQNRRKEFMNCLTDKHDTVQI